MPISEIAEYGWITALDSHRQLQIENVRETVKPILQTNLLPHFTDHSISHSDRVVGILGRLLERNLSQNSSTRLNEREIVVLVLAGILHDIAMQIPKAYGIDSDVTGLTPKDMSRIRQLHGEVAAAILRDIANGSDSYNLGLGQDDLKRFLPLVAAVSEKHQSRMCYDPNETVPLGSERIRIGLLTGLLRLADQLDCDSRRVHMNLLRHYTIPLESVVHWIVCHYVDSVTIEKGFVEITASYPDTLSGPVIQLLSKKLLEKLRAEYKKAERILWENDVALRIPDNIASMGTAYTYEKQPIPEEVISLLKNQLSGIEPTHAAILKEEKERATATDHMDFMSYWGFIGNPFLDRPVSYGSDLFVETPLITEILSETGQHLHGPSGDLRIVIGGRGLGKTTLFQSIDDRFGSEYSVHVIDVADQVVDVRTTSDLHNLILASIRTTLKPDEKEERPERLVELAKYGKKKVLCIDSLDRLPEDKLDAVRGFFKTSQRFLTELRGVSVVFIAFAENWGSFLANKEFSYLGTRNQWKLEPFSTKQIKEMLDKRLRSSGRDYLSIFDESCSIPLHTISSGNPRSVLEHAEAICRLAAREGIKRIGADFIHECYQERFDQTIQSLVASLSASSGSLKKGLVALYVFYLDMERRNLSPTEGWGYLLEMLKGELPQTKVSPAFYPSLGAIGYLTASSRPEVRGQFYRAHSQVAEVFKELKKKGFTAEDFVSFYSARPIRPVEEEDQVLLALKSTLVAGESAEHYEKARQLYFDLKKEDRPPFQVITMAWDCIEGMIVAILTKHTNYDSKAFEAAKEAAYFTDRQNIKKQRDDAGKILSDVAFNLVKEFVEYLRREWRWMNYYNSMKWIRDTRSNIIKGQSKHLLQYGEREKDICLRHIDPVYRELVQLLG
jgi:type II secretory pathway predicted ATPase ExeA